MRILFLSNYYPPFEVGGYEQLCRDVAVRLVDRGHTIAVLTSDRGVERDKDLVEPGVHRLLRIQPQYGTALSPAAQFFLTRRQMEAYNRRISRAVAERFRPDVVFIWNLQGLPQQLALDAETWPGVGVAYWLAGYTPAEPDSYWRYWTQPPRGNGLFKHTKNALSRLALAQMRREGKPVQPQMRHVAAVSEYMRQRGIVEGTLPAHTRIIYNGVELDQFIVLKRSHGNTLRLLLAGRVSEDKGVHTAIKAIETLVRACGSPNIHLTIVGKGPDDYRQDLLSYVETQGLGAYIDFCGWIAREQMPQIMTAADVLLLPSIYPEALPRVVLEAMACGLAVIATPAGGTGEIVRHDVTGLLCAAEDSDDLAAQIQRLLTEPGLRERLASSGQALVSSQFSIDHMVDDLEDLLVHALEG